MIPKETYSRTRKRDLRASMAGALKDYLATLEFRAGNRPFKFLSIYDSWPTWLKGGQPSACVLPDEKLVYERVQGNPLLEETWEPQGEAGWGLYQLSEGTCEMNLLVRAPTDGERSAIIADLEQAFIAGGASGIDETGRRRGLLLPMESYYRLDARFTLKEHVVLDDQDTAAKSRNEAIFMLTAQAPQVRLDVVRPFVARVTQDVS